MISETTVASSHQDQSVPQAAFQQVGYRLTGSQLPGPAKIPTQDAPVGTMETRILLEQTRISKQPGDASAKCHRMGGAGLYLRKLVSGILIHGDGGFNPTRICDGDDPCIHFDYTTKGDQILRTCRFGWRAGLDFAGVRTDAYRPLCPTPKSHNQV